MGFSGCLLCCLSLGGRVWDFAGDDGAARVVLLVVYFYSWWCSFLSTSLGASSCCSFLAVFFFRRFFLLLLLLSLLLDGLLLSVASGGSSLSPPPRGTQSGRFHNVLVAPVAVTCAVCLGSPSDAARGRLATAVAANSALLLPMLRFVLLEWSCRWQQWLFVMVGCVSFFASLSCHGIVTSPVVRPKIGVR